MKTFITTMALAITLMSCSIFQSLTSTTLIKSNESFILGNNEHGPFSVKLKNTSGHDLKVFMAPIKDGTHSPVIVKPSETISVKTDRDTALVIENKADKDASVKLRIKGDTGLSMGYRN